MNKFHPDLHNEILRITNIVHVLRFGNNIIKKVHNPLRDKGDLEWRLRRQLLKEKGSSW